MVSNSVLFSDDLKCSLENTYNQFILEKIHKAKQTQELSKKNSCHYSDANQANVGIWLCEEKQTQRWKGGGLITPQSLKMNVELKSDSWINGVN